MPGFEQICTCVYMKTADIGDAFIPSGHRRYADWFCVPQAKFIKTQDGKMLPTIATSQLLLSFCQS